MSVKFKIVVPTFNAQQWIHACVNSIAAQVYTDFECVIVNDASTDKTADVLESISYLKDDPRFTVLHCDKNLGPLASHVIGWKKLKVSDEPESVCVTVDGDDRLFSEYSLAICAAHYEQTNCLMTYGNHIHYPSGESSNCISFPPEVIAKNSFRDFKFVSSHLRTFKAKLWNNIQDEDLRDWNGEYYRAAGDFAIMIPIMEMAGARHSFIRNILYFYNRMNPLGEEYAKASENSAAVDHVRAKSRYEPYEL